MTARRSLFAALLAAAALVSGCAMDLPLVERIASVRPLGLRVEVLEDPPADPVRAEALPFETVQMLPLMGDPQGLLDEEAIAQTEPLWLACALQPIEGLFACLSNKLPLDPEDVPLCPADGGSPTENAPSPCIIPTTTPAQPTYTVPFDSTFLLGGDLEITSVAHVPGEGNTEECLSALLGQDTIPESCIISVQRLSVGPDRALYDLAADAGIVIPGDPPPEAEPDTHPRIQSMQVTVLENGEEVMPQTPVLRGETLTVKRGQLLQLRAITPDSDLQEYPIPRDDGFTTQRELYSGSWFITWGELQNPTSNDPISLNQWSIEQGSQDDDELPPDGRAVLTFVQRDGRQGIDSWWFAIDVTE